MTPYDHSLLSVRDFKGSVEDYLPIHNFLDQTKFQTTNFRHRAMLHNTFGISLCEQVFGSAVETSDGAMISVREIARRHIMQDCGCVPTMQDCFMAIEQGTYGNYNRPNEKDLKWLKENNYNGRNLEVS